VGTVDETTVLMLADAQTPGGRLFGADPGPPRRPSPTFVLPGATRPWSGR